MIAMGMICRWGGGEDVVDEAVLGSALSTLYASEGVCQAVDDISGALPDPKFSAEASAFESK